MARLTGLFAVLAASIVSAGAALPQVRMVANGAPLTIIASRHAGISGISVA